MTEQAPADPSNFGNPLTVEEMRERARRMLKAHINQSGRGDTWLAAHGWWQTAEICSRLESNK
jgi:hypothetical protein